MHMPRSFFLLFIVIIGRVVSAIIFSRTLPQSLVSGSGPERRQLLKYIILFSHFFILFAL